MWTCPKCGRTFKRQEQSHYCGKAPEAVREFSERLEDYKTSKGTIQLPYTGTVPAGLISDIARWCYETGNHHVLLSGTGGG